MSEIMARRDRAGISAGFAQREMQGRMEAIGGSGVMSAGVSRGGAAKK